MTVFKTFFRIVNKLKPTIILYTALLIIFGAVNMKTSDNNINFVNSKPDILIINQDVNKGLTKNLIDYMKKNSNIVKVENNEKEIKIKGKFSFKNIFTNIKNTIFNIFNRK